LIEKIAQKTGEEFVLDKILMIGDKESGECQIGKPFLSGARVAARVLDQIKDDKKIVFKYSSKTRYKKKKGHRQPLSKIEVLKISA